MLIFQAGVIQPVHAQLCCTALFCTCLQENDWVTCYRSRKVVPSFFPSIWVLQLTRQCPWLFKSTSQKGWEILWAHCAFHGLTAALNQIAIPLNSQNFHRAQKSWIFQSILTKLVPSYSCIESHVGLWSSSMCAVRLQGNMSTASQGFVKGANFTLKPLPGMWGFVLFNFWGLFMLKDVELDWLPQRKSHWSDYLT